MKLLVGVLIVTAAALLYWAVASAPSEEQTIPVPTLEDRDPAGSDKAASSPSVAQSEIEVTTAPSDPSRREEVVSNSVLRGRIRDAAGRPLTGAEITWSKLPEPDYSDSQTWSLDQNDFPESELRTRSDDSGFFEFGAHPAGVLSRESVLWITHPSYEALPRLLKPVPETWTAVEEFTLDGPRMFLVTVVMEDGSSVEGATVDQLGLRTVPDQGPRSWLTCAYRIFRRAATTRSAGRVALSPLKGKQILYARKDGLESAPWFGDGIGDSSPTLVLRSGFSVIGFVRSEMGFLPEDLQIAASSRKGSMILGLKQVEVTREGRWDPMLLPLVSDEYLFDLSGTGVVGQRETIHDPGQSEEIFLEFVARAATPLTITVEDEEGLAIEAAEVFAWWSGESGKGSSAARSDAEGVARLSGCAPTTVTVEVSAQGFMPLGTLVMDLSDGALRTATVTLKKAGRIVGRCLHEGIPVGNFEVYCWQGSPFGRITETVIASEDGRFEIDRAPLGEVALCAVSEDYPRSDLYTLVVSPDQPAEVTIELPDPIQGVGRVVDNRTGTPIPSATVQLYSNHRGHYFDAWGPAHEVDGDGRFDIRGFAPGDTRFVVEAQGYAVWLGQGLGIPGKVLDIGVIPLARTQPLELRLTSGQPVDYTQYRARARGNQWYPIQSFSSDGVLTYDEAGPGEYLLRIYAPDGTQKDIETVLYSGADWTFEIPVRSGKQLTVRVRGTGGRPASECGVRWVAASSRAPSDLTITEFKDLPADEKVVFAELSGDEIVVEALDATEKRLGVSYAKLEASESELELTVGSPGLHLRVVDRKGAALPGTTLRVTSPTVVSGWAVQVTTDSQGEYHFASLSVPSLVVHLSHPTLGMRTGIPVSLDEADDQFVELVLDPDAKLRIRIKDGSEPLPGVHSYVYDETGSFLVGTFASDSAGRIASGPLEQGTYRVVVQQPGIWKTEQVVAVTPQQGEIDLQVRRLGAVALALINPIGTPFSGALVDLRSEEFDVDVSDWLEQGLVPTPAGGLRTNTLGRLVIEGVPNGRYQYSIEHTGAEALTGSLMVPPRSTAAVRVIAP